MDLSEILAIAGKPGLYKMISQTSKGLIVESLETKKRFPVYSAHEISALAEISIYTYEDDVPLADVFKNLHTYLNDHELISPKSSKNKLSSFFSEVLPDYNEEQVYASDIKKIIQWYSALNNAGLMTFEEEDLTKEEGSEDKNKDESLKEEEKES